MNLTGIKGLKAINSDEPIPAKRMLFVIYAPPGVGKTSLAATSAGPFVLDFDNGIERANGTFRMAKATPRPFTIKIDDYEALRNLVDGAMANEVKEGGYQTAIIDTGGTFLDNHMAPWLVRKDSKNGNNMGGLSMGGWGAMAIEFNRFINKLKSMGLNVVVICHSKKEEKELSLDMKGSSKTILAQSSDMIGFLEVRGDGRYLSFDPKQDRIGKNTANMKDVKVPSADSEEFTLTLQRIFDATAERMAGQTEAQRDAINQTNEMVKQIKKAKGLEELTAIELQASTMSPTYQDTIRKHVAPYYAKFYAEAHFDSIEDLDGIEAAREELRAAHEQENDRGKMMACWKLLVAKAKEQGYNWDGEGRKFVETKNKEDASDKAADATGDGKEEDSSQAEQPGDQPELEFKGDEK